MDAIDAVIVELLSKPLFHPDIPNIHKVNDFTIQPGKGMVILVFGPSGAGKDCVIKRHLDSGAMKHVVTATTRRRRYEFPDAVPVGKRQHIANVLMQIKGEKYLDVLDELHKQGRIIAEPRESYVWMPQYDPDIYGPYEKYIEDLREEYDLLEWDIHHDDLYGLPRANVSKASSSEVAVIRTEPNGVRVLLKKLTNFNCIALAILPDSFDDLVTRIKERVVHTGGENIETRINDSIRWIHEMPELAHLVLRNSKQPANGLSGLENSIKSLGLLLSELKLVHSF